MEQKQEPRMLTVGEAAALLPARNPGAHKGNFGRMLIVAGSAGYTGAAALCTLAALRMGAGIVTLASVLPVLAAAQAKLYEPTFLTLPDNGAGQIAAQAVEPLLERAQSASALLVGCGLGLSSDGKALTAGLLRSAPCPLLIDADGLNAVAGRLWLLREAKHPPVLTPHMGEMARLTGLDVETIQADPRGCAAAFAREHRCIVVLKDADTVVAAADGRLFLYEGRNAGMARGGSGDVLAGFAASLLAQGLEPAEAAAAAVRLHGAAGMRCALRSSKVAMLPHELPEALGGLLLERGL